jgi:hypothetical protein
LTDKIIAIFVSLFISAGPIEGPVQERPNGLMPAEETVVNVEVVGPPAVVPGWEDHGPDFDSCDAPVDQVLFVFDAARAGGFSGADLPVAVAVAFAESLGDPEARNVNRDGSVDSGLWQVNSIHGFEGDLFNPIYNAQSAFWVFERQGWRAWYAHTPKGGGFGSGERFQLWLPKVNCVLTEAGLYGTLVAPE